jgi:hypothetical protein
MASSGGTPAEIKLLIRSAPNGMTAFAAKCEAGRLRAEAQLEEMTKDRDLWADEHNGDCPNVARAERAEALLREIVDDPSRFLSVLRQADELLSHPKEGTDEN